MTYFDGVSDIHTRYTKVRTLRGKFSEENAEQEKIILDKDCNLRVSRRVGVRRPRRRIRNAVIAIRCVHLRKG